MHKIPQMPRGDDFGLIDNMILFLFHRFLYELKVQILVHKIKWNYLSLASIWFHVHVELYML
jgi:hypothetical protein